MASRYHGSKISRSHQPFMKETAPSDRRKVLAVRLVLSAIIHRKVIHVFFFFAIFAGPWFVEIEKFCYMIAKRRNDFTPI